MTRRRRPTVDELEPRSLLSANPITPRPPYVDTIPNTVANSAGTVYATAVVSTTSTTGTLWSERVEVHDPSGNLASVAAWYGEESGEDEYDLSGLENLPITVDDDGDKYVTLEHTYDFPGVFGGAFVIRTTRTDGYVPGGYTTAFNVTVTGKPAVMFDRPDQVTPIHSGNVAAIVPTIGHHHRNHHHKASHHAVVAR